MKLPEQVLFFLQFPLKFFKFQSTFELIVHF